MLISLPIGTNKKAIANREATNRMTIEIFKAFWQKVSPDLEFPGMQAGDDASYVEWEKYGNKYYGMRKPGDAKHGIVRIIDSKNGWIREATYCDDKEHGLSFYWTEDYLTASEAIIYNHGEEKAYITWRADWSERNSDNKELILETNGLNIFKP